MKTNPGTSQHGGFLVELFVDRLATRDWREVCVAARGVGRWSARLATPVRYVRSIVVPDDEVCFHVFEGGSIADVEAALLAGGIRGDRVSSALLVDAVDPSGGTRDNPDKENEQ